MTRAAFALIILPLFCTLVFGAMGDALHWLPLNCVPVVIAGYDAVAYFDLAFGSCESVKGRAEFAYNLASNDENGIARYYQFWFASQVNLDRFQTDPWKYAPRFGGFCSYGTCCELQDAGWLWQQSFLGPPAGPDPSNCGFRVHNGSLYFNIWRNYDDVFFRDADAHIPAAEKRWISWFDSLHAGVFNFDCFSAPGWEYIDCVHNGQVKAPKVSDVDAPNSQIVGCGVPGVPPGSFAPTTTAVVTTASTPEVLPYLPVEKSKSSEQRAYILIGAIIGVMSSALFSLCACYYGYRFIIKKRAENEVAKLSAFSQFEDDDRTTSRQTITSNVVEVEKFDEEMDDKTAAIL